MPLKLKPRSPLAPFTFALSPSPSSPDAHDSNSVGTAAIANVPRPPADFIPEKDMYMFGTYPLLGAGEVGRGTIKCKRCGKVGLEWAAGEHRRICTHVLDGTPLTNKKVTKTTKSETTKKRRASEVSESASISPTKKRAKFPVEPSVDEEDDEPLASHSASGATSLKMKKSELKKLEKDRARAEKREAKQREKLEIAERKRQRATNPINLDRQCGVINDKNIPCARSLTCKTHTVGAKRGVEGRSRPYDELYNEWQRAHNPNYKEPAKRDKVEKEKKVSIQTSSFAATAKAKALKKKKLYGGFGRSTFGNFGDEGLRDDEDGHRELEDLIAITKLAGDRVKNNFGRIGYNPNSGPITSSKVIPPGALNRQNSSASGNGNGIAMTTKGGNSSGSSSSTITSTISNNSSTINFLSIWKSTANDYTDVGTMLTKALSARIKPTPIQNHKSSSAAATAAATSGGGGGGGNRGMIVPPSAPTQLQAQAQAQGMRIPMPMTMPMSSGQGVNPGQASTQAQAQAQAYALAQAQALTHQSQMARQQLVAAAAATAGGGGNNIPQNQGMYVTA